MREDELLARIRERSAHLPERFGAVRVGPGDDCAVLATSGDLVIGVDQLVEGRHFEPATPIDAIARKLVARAISDLAAMGATPAWGLATGVLPHGYEHADQLFDAMHEWANRHACPLVGGDIASSGSSTPLTLTMTAAGHPHSARGPVLRSTAVPADALYVTGTIGGSFPSGRHLAFEPRVPEAQWLCDTLADRLHAMIDISDGLAMDAARIGTASGVGIEIEAGRLPLSPGCTDPVRCASDGEDYELLFTAAGDVPDRCPNGTRVTRIGRVVARSGCRIILPDDAGGTVIDGDRLGWDHTT